MSPQAQIIIMAVCLLMSAYFSATETAFSTLSKTKLKTMIDKGNKRASLALKLSENYDRLLSTILIGNNLANIAVSTCTTLLVMQLFPKHVGLASTVATIVVTVVILICGEIVPKVLAKQHADRVVRWVAVPTRVLTLILSPVVAIVMLLLAGLRKLWGQDKSDTTVTEEELVSIIDTVEEEGVIDEEQSELLQSTIDFHDTTVAEIMTPRIDMTALDIDDSMDQIREILSDSTQYSRLPVYEDSIDNIIGVLSLTRYYKATLDTSEPDIRELMMKPCKIHKTMKLPAALNKLREMKMHLAIVIDEFGGTLGVVTMEDILEELVGDIWDDTDVIVTECVATGENTYEVTGDMNIDDCFEELEFHKPEDFACEYSTMGGWSVEMLEADPHVGDSFSYRNLHIVVAQMEEERVTRLTVLVTAAEDREDEE